MIAAAIRAELADLFEKVGELVLAQPLETRCECVMRAVVGDMRGIFAALGPFERNAEGVQHFLRGAFRDDFHAESFADLAGFARGTLSAARAGGRAFEDGIDER